jgi:hypothetical protein
MVVRTQCSLDGCFKGFSCWVKIIASFRDLVKRLVQAEGIDGFSDPLSPGGAGPSLRPGNGFTELAFGAGSVIEHP